MNTTTSGVELQVNTTVTQQRIVRKTNMVDFSFQKKKQ